MKRILIVTFCLAFFSRCGGDVGMPSGDNINYKEEMRNFVIGISDYGKALHSNFIIIPQNGIELVTTTGDETGSPHTPYLNAIDGNGQEDLFYGYDNDDQQTSSTDTEYLQTFLDISKNAGNTILVTDYCYTTSKMTDSYSKNNAAGYISFAADHRELDDIPDFPTSIFNVNSAIITSLKPVQNFLYLINPVNFSSKTQFINSITATNYDLLIMDLFFQDGSEFTSSEISQLKNKANGGKRLVICYMSIGEAEDYRYYWDQSWNTSAPSWLAGENPDWPGNFKVRYWEKGWQDIIFGNDNSYLKKIIDANFDGVYLDIIDAFEYYE